MSSLAEEYPKQQARCRELLGQYKEIGPAGIIGGMIIEDVLRRADQAVAEGDVVAMCRMYEEMKGLK